jgi:hypothetical protein
MEERLFWRGRINSFKVMVTYVGDIEKDLRDMTLDDYKPPNSLEA